MGAHAGAAPRVGESPERYQICRSTTRIRIDFDRLSKTSEKELKDELRAARRRCATAANLVIRTFFRADTDALDAFQLEHRRLPAKAKELPVPKVKNNGYNLIRKAVPELASSIAVAVAKKAADKWKNDRWEALVFQKRGIPYFRDEKGRSGPVPIGSDAYKLVEEEDGSWWLATLLSTDGERQRIPLEIRDDHQREAIARIAAGLLEVNAYRRARRATRRKRAKSGDTTRKKSQDTASVVSPHNWAPGIAAIEQDKRRPGRWYVRLSYKRLVEKSDGEHLVVIHRGIRNFIVALTDGGDYWPYHGNDIAHRLKKLQHRRRQIQRDAKASGRNGRGRRKILRPLKPLMDKGAAFRATKSQTIARRLAEWCVARGVGRYRIEDLSGIRYGEPERLEGGERAWRMVQEWPYHDLGMRIESCLQEAGIQGETQPAYFVSHRCPACGHVDKANRDLKRWRLNCTSCEYNKDLERAACENALARAQALERGEKWELDEMFEKKRAPTKKSNKKRRRKKKK